MITNSFFINITVAGKSSFTSHSLLNMYDKVHIETDVPFITVSDGDKFSELILLFMSNELVASTGGLAVELRKAFVDNF